jgi:hypothetical protein
MLADSNGFWNHNRTCVVLALAFALLSWSVAAASYSATTEPETQPGYETLSLPATRLGRHALAARLAIEGVSQIPNLHHVLSYAIWDKPWLLCLFLGLEAVPLGAWFLLRRVERELEKPRRRTYK